MYLDSHEQALTERLIISAHVSWFLQRMNRIGVSQAITMVVFVGLFVLGIALIPEESNHWMKWVLCILLCACTWVSHRHHSKRRMNALKYNTPKQWIEEIADVDVSAKERVLFSEILTAAEEGTTEELLALIKRALRTPILSQTALIKALETHLEVK